MVNYFQFHIYVVITAMLSQGNCQGIGIPAPNLITKPSTLINFLTVYHNQLPFTESE